MFLLSIHLLPKGSRPRLYVLCLKVPMKWGTESDELNRLNTGKVVKLNIPPNFWLILRRASLQTWTRAVFLASVDKPYGLLSTAAASQACWARSSSEIRSCGSYLSILLGRSVKLADYSAEILGKGAILLLIASSRSIWRYDCSVSSMLAPRQDVQVSRRCLDCFWCAGEILMAPFSKVSLRVSPSPMEYRWWEDWSV